MVLTPITAARLTVACLAASLGWGSFWAKVQTPSEQPVSRATDDSGFGTLHNDAILAMEKLQTASALVDDFVAEEASLSSKAKLSFAHVDGISAIESLQTVATLIESVPDVSSHRRPEIETIQPPPITGKSDAPNPWGELPSIEVVALSWGETVRAFSRNVSPMAWPIISSFPLDCLLMFVFFTWRRWRCSGKTPDQSTERNLNGNEEPEASHHVVEDLDDEVGGDIDVHPTSLATDVDLADVTPMPSKQNDTQPSAEQKPTRRSPKSAGVLKAWTEKQRELCDIAENTQAYLTATISAEHDEGHAENAVPLIAAPQSLRNRSRSGAELKALMEKKRDECHVLESSQKHVNTDAKAAGCSSKPDGENDVATHTTDTDSTLTTASARRCNTSSKEVKEWMSRLKNRCEVIEGPTPVFVETDAKSSARPVKSPPNKDNMAYVEETSATTESSQEHVNTDAKATRCPVKPDGKNDVATLKVYVDSTLTTAPARRCNTSSKEVKEWMSRLKNRCEVIEGPAPVFVETDAKSSAEYKENIAT